jgi:putative membrane protein
MVDTYAWIKAFHIIAVIAWMAGMLYLPRLFVYHCAAQKGSVQSETFKLMERRLLRGIINPAMLATIVLGLWLAWLGPDSRYGWFASGWLRNRHSQKFYRIINEVPTVLLILIVLLVVLKPF